MFKASLLTILGISLSNGITFRCPAGSGNTVDNPCKITSQQLQVDEGITIDIPSSINYAEIDCSNKGCEKKVTAFLGAKDTKILCPTADSCLASRFYCARGPPDQNQDLYRGITGLNGFEPTCTLNANSGVSSVAKETEFIVFKPGKGIVKAIGDVAFGTALYRCYSNNCELECGEGSCVDTEFGGDNTIKCTGDCPEQSDGDPFLNPPIVANPNSNGDCIINANDLSSTDSKTKIVFKNNCKNAKLNCDTNPGICEKRKIYCGAQNKCDIQCGGKDPQKLNENPIPFISGPCKEAEFILGPFLFGLPYKTNEADFDRPIILNEPTLLNVNINLQGNDAGSKVKINAVFTSVTINANGAKTFGEGSIICGFEGTPPDNRLLPITTCTLKCIGDNINGFACEKCKFKELGGVFNSIGESCSNAANSNRISVKQNSIHNIYNNNNTQNTGNQVNPILLVISVVAVVILVSVVSLLLYKNNNKKNVNNKTGLTKYNTMNELASIETK